MTYIYISNASQFLKRKEKHMARLEIHGLGERTKKRIKEICKNLEMSESQWGKFILLEYLKKEDEKQK